MSKRLSLPKNKEKFNLYAPFVRQFYRSGIIAQIISGVTAFIVYYAICQTRFGEFWGAVISTGFVLLIELGQRTSFPAVTDYFLAKGKNKIEHVLGIHAIVAGVLFVALSTYGSLKIVPVAVDEKVAEAQEKTTDEADFEYQERKIVIVNDYEREKQINDDLLASRIESNKMLFQSKIDKQKASQLKWKQRGEREKRSYESRVKAFEVVIANLKTDRDSIESSLIAANDFALTNLTQEHKAKLSEIDNRLFAEIEKVDTHNSEQASNVVNKKNSFTGVGILLILICQFWCVASIVARKLFLRLSEVDEIYHPNQYYFEETIFEKYNEAFSRFFNYYLGELAEVITSKIPEATAKRPATLLDYGDGAQEIKKVEFEDYDENATIVVPAKNPAKFVATEEALLSQKRPEPLSDKASGRDVENPATVKTKIVVKHIGMKNECDKIGKRWIRAMKKGDVEKAQLVEKTDIQDLIDKGFVVTYNRPACKISIRQGKK